MVPSKAQYVGTNGRIHWTSNVNEAKQLAKAVDGVAVDADWLSTNWNEWRKTGVIPPEATPEKTVRKAK